MSAIYFEIQADDVNRASGFYTRGVRLEVFRGRGPSHPVLAH